MPITTSSQEALALFLEGRHLMESGEVFSADTLLKQAVQLDPDFALAHVYMHMGAGIDKAMAISDFVTPGEQLLIRAYHAQQNRDYQSACRFVDSLTRMYPKDKHCLLYANHAYFYVDPDKALEYLNRALKIDPYYGAAYNLLGYELEQLGRLDEARKAYEDYMDYSPQSANAIDSYAHLLVRMGDFEQALDQFRKVQDYDPTNLFVSVKIAWLHLLFDAYEQAEHACLDLYHSDLESQDKAWGVFMMAHIRFIQEDFTGTMEILDAYLQELETTHNPLRKGYAIHQKGWYALRTGKYEQAIDLFANGLQLAMDDNLSYDEQDALSFCYHGGLSVAYGEMGSREESETHLQKARILFDAIRPHAYLQGMLNSYEAAYAILNGNFDKAISHLTSGPVSVSSIQRYYRGKTYELIGDTAKALSYYQEILTCFDQFMAGFFYSECKQKVQELKE